MTWQDEYSAKIMKSAALPSRELVRGEGCYVWDDTGAKYLDFLAGIAVNALGHAHPVLVDAVSRQIATVAHVSNYFANPPQLELAARLTRLTGGDRECHRNAKRIGEVIRTGFNDVHDSRIGTGRKASRLGGDHQLIGFGCNGLGAAIGRIHPDPSLVRAQVVGVLVGSRFAER